MVAEGTDFAGTDDIDPAWRTVGGRLATAEALARALQTPLGTLPDFPSYGYDLLDAVGTTQRDNVIIANIQNQAGQIETIEAVNVTLDRTNQDSDLSIQIIIFDADGPFTLTVNISGLEITSIVPDLA